MKKIPLWLVLAGIVLIGAIFRLDHFASVPTGLNRDEMALGYNAYALLQSDHDEWGKFLPVVFRSFGDFKLGGYIYATIPFIWGLGLNEYAVRLPSLFAGLLLPIVFYYFIRTLTKNTHLAVLSAALLAVSPWAIFYSRVGFEANFALPFFLTGLALYWKSLTENRYPWLSVLCFLISFLTYNSPLILAPMIIVLCLALYRRRALLPSIGISVAIICAAALVFPAIQGKGSITVFSDAGIIEQSNQLYQKAGNNPLMRLGAKPFVLITRTIIQHYVSSFSPEFLVIRGGGNPWHQVSGSGHLTWVLYVLSMGGIAIALLRHKKDDLLMLGLLAIGPIPSAITMDAPHATRSLFFFVMLCVFAARVLELWWRQSRVLVCVVLIGVLLSSVAYQYRYMRVLGSRSEVQWNGGISAALQRAGELHAVSSLPIVVVGDVHYSYIGVAFYTMYDPKTFQRDVEYYGNDNVGLSQVKRLGIYQFVSTVKDAPHPSIVVEHTPEGEYNVVQTQ